MLTIAVCDDNELDLNTTEAEIYNSLKKLNKDCNISLFTTSENLLYELQDGTHFDIFILDVSMPVKNGFELAEDIRKINDDAVIMFLTSHNCFASKGYMVRALRYISKVNMQNELTEALQAAVNELNKNEKFIVFRRYNDFRRVSVNDIISVTRVARQLRITTTKDEEIADNRGISALFDEINDSRFIFIDRSCFVNTEYIVSLTGDSITMKNGDTLVVSRRSLKWVKTSLLSLWSKNN